MSLRYARAKPLERTADFLEIELEERHEPPVYLARIRLFQERETALDSEHVIDVAKPVLERLACRSVEDYVENACLLERARALVNELARGERPAKLERDGLRCELERGVVPGTLDPRERAVYRVFDHGDAAFVFWLPDEKGAGELAWVSRRFRADDRIKARAVEHGLTYVGWALGELAPVRKSLLETPKTLDLGWPLPTTI